MVVDACGTLMRELREVCYDIEGADGKLGCLCLKTKEMFYV